MRNHIHRYTLTIVVCVATAGAASFLVVGAGASAAGKSSPRGPHAPAGYRLRGARHRARVAASNPAQAVPEVSAIEPTQAQDFGVLDANGSVPAGIVKMINRSPTASRFGLNPSLGRAVGSEGDAWLIPGEGEVCLWITDPVDGGGLGCATDAQADAGLLSLSLVGAGSNPSAHIVGVVPDGVSTVNVSGQDANSTVTVRQDAWETTLPDQQLHVGFKTGALQHRVSAA